MSARARKAQVAILPVAFPPLDRQRCVRCDKQGVHVVAMWQENEVPREALFCEISCARGAGWPWLDVATSEALWRARRKESAS
jgi:hypothetical protein